MMDFTVKTKGEEIVMSVPGLCDYLFSYFGYIVTVFYYLAMFSNIVPIIVNLRA